MSRTSIRRKPEKRGWYLHWRHIQHPPNGHYREPVVVYCDPEGSPDEWTAKRPVTRGWDAAWIYLGDDPERVSADGEGEE